MHQALYRKYRPRTFDDVCGQEHITSVLAYQSEHNKFSHAYLFCGSRGTGKTTCAKILAKAANCQNKINGNPCNACDTCRSIDAGTSVDVLEMDAASNTGVDYIRDIREEVVFTPSDMSTRVYIIDEVHMLTESAFNALLKTLEEPPQGVIFVLATTELQKIPSTILSRCQRYDFRRISVKVISERLAKIASVENISLDSDAAMLIARLAQGGMRDAVSMMELCAGKTGNITLQSVYDAAGLCGRQTVEDMIVAIQKRNCGDILTYISSMYKSAVDLSVFVADLMAYYRDMLIKKVLALKQLSGESHEILDLSDSEFTKMCSLADGFRKETLLYHLRQLDKCYTSMNRGSDKRITLETTLMRMASGIYDDSPEALAERISALETKIVELAAGGFVPTPNPSTQQNNASEGAYSGEFTDTAELLEETANTGDQFDDWAEIVAKYDELDSSVSPFLKSASAYRDGKTFYVDVSDAFQKKMLETAGASARIRALLVSEGTSVDEVKIRVVTEKKSTDDLDDFI